MVIFLRQWRSEVRAQGEPIPPFDVRWPFAFRSRLDQPPVEGRGRIARLAWPVGSAGASPLRTDPRPTDPRAGDGTRSGGPNIDTRYPRSYIHPPQ